MRTQVSEDIPRCSGRHAHAGRRLADEDWAHIKRAVKGGRPVVATTTGGDFGDGGTASGATANTDADVADQQHPDAAIDGRDTTGSSGLRVWCLVRVCGSSAGLAHRARAGGARRCRTSQKSVRIRDKRRPRGREPLWHPHDSNVLLAAWGAAGIVCPRFGHSTPTHPAHQRSVRTRPGSARATSPQARPLTPGETDQPGLGRHYTRPRRRPRPSHTPHTHKPEEPRNRRLPDRRRPRLHGDRDRR